MDGKNFAGALASGIAIVFAATFAVAMAQQGQGSVPQSGKLPRSTQAPKQPWPSAEDVVFDVGNGYSARLGARYLIKIQAGTSLQLRLAAQARRASQPAGKAWVVRWENLTPETLQTVSSENGVFRPIKTGYGVVRADVFAGTIARTGQPLYTPAMVLVEVTPIAKIVEWKGPQLLVRGKIQIADFRGYRWSSSRNPADKARKNQAVKDASLRNAFAATPNPKPNVEVSKISTTTTTERDGTSETQTRTRTETTIRTNESDVAVSEQQRRNDLTSLQTALPMEIVSLTPEVLKVADSSGNFSQMATIQPEQQVLLQGLCSGEGRVRARCGGIEAEFAYQVVSPVLEIQSQTPHPTAGSPVNLVVKFFDRDTKKECNLGLGTSGDAKLKISVLDPKKATIQDQEVALASSVAYAFTPKVKGEYKVEAHLSDQKDCVGATSIDVREQITQLVTDRALVQAVVGDTVIMPVRCLDSSGTQVPVAGDELSVSATTEPKHQPVTPAPTVLADGGKLSISVPVLSLRSLEVVVKGPGTTSVGFQIQPLPQLEIISTRISERAARDLFGPQVAKEFLIRQLTFRNNLGSVTNALALRDRSILLFGESLIAHVILANDARNVTPAQLDAAVGQASYLWSRPRDLRELVRRKEVHTKSIYAFLFGNGKAVRTKIAAIGTHRNGKGPDGGEADEGLSDAPRAIVIPYAPVLYQVFQQMREAIDARRSEERLDRALQVIGFITTALSKLPQVENKKMDDSLWSSFGDWLIPIRNPFISSSSDTVRQQMEWMFKGILEIQRGVRDKSGKALNGPAILENTLTITSDSAVRRYLFIPRDTMESKRGHTKVWIMDIVDESLHADYVILTNEKVNTSAPSATSD